MKISKTATSSDLHKAPSQIYSNVLEGKITRITTRGRKPMVLMTEADFLKLAKKVQG